MNLPDIYFLPEWGKAHQDLEKGDASVFEFEDQSGHIYYQFIKRRVSDGLDLGLYYDIITQYGCNGPIILDHNPAEKEKLLSRFDEIFNEYCRDEKIIAEYVRFSPWLKNHQDFGKFYTLKYNDYTLYTDLTVGDFFMEEYCSKIRTKIRKSQKLGVRIEYDLSGKSLNEFCNLYKQTIQKNEISDYYHFDENFLLRVFKSLNNRQFLINARFEDKYISSAIFMEFGDYLHFHLVANDYNHYEKNGNSLIMYEAAMWGQKNGKKQMHIGGGTSGELFAFKKQFTKKGICDFYIGKKVRDEHVYSKLVDLKIKTGQIHDTSYFPLYRD